MRLWGTACLLVCIGLAPAAADAKPRLSIDGAKRGVGDGATTLELSVRVTPASAVASLAGLSVDADAGLVSDIQPAGTDAVTVVVTLPRVVVPTRVRVVATARAGRARLRAEHPIEAQPPAPELGTQVSRGPFGLTGPARVLLGTTRSVEISLPRPKAGRPQLLASVGTLSPLKAAPGNRLVATYSPPEQKFPQMAFIVAALGGVYDVITIPLYGQGKVQLKSEPNARVKVVLPGLEIGPVRTDSRGRAALVIAAPPGVGHLATIATDHLGNVSRGRLVLGAPPVPRLFATCPPGQAGVLLFAVTSRGAPRKSLSAKLEASAGTLGAPKLLAPGVFEAVYNADEAAKIGDVVQLTAKTKEGASSCRTTLAGELPRRMAVAFSRPTFVAGSGPVAVNVRLEYPGRMPRRDPTVKFEVERGKLSSPVRVSDDEYALQWTLPDALGTDPPEASFTAYAEEEALVAGTSRLRLEPGPAARIELSGPDELDMIPGAPITIRAQMMDEFGNPVAGATLSGRANHGKLGEFSARGGGRFEATYRDRGARVDRVTVTMADSDVSSSLELNLSGGARRLSIAARGGYLSNLRGVDGPALSFGLGYRLPVFRSRLRVGLESGLYAMGDSAASQGPNPEPVDSSLFAVPILARASVGVRLGKVLAYAGGTAGVSVLRTMVSSDSVEQVVAVSVRPAAGAFAGGEWRVGPGAVVLEAGYLHTRIDRDEIRGRAGGLSFTGGYRLGL